jgi:hypothetical protein
MNTLKMDLVATGSDGNSLICLMQLTKQLVCNVLN